MSELGIKSFLNYVTCDVGSAGKVYIYPKHKDLDVNDMYVLIPIYNSTNIDKINVNLIYSKATRNSYQGSSTSSYTFNNEFGCGIKLDSRIEMSFQNGKVIKINPDGSNTEYYQTENQNIYIELENYTKYDKTNHQIIYSDGKVINLDIKENATTFKGYPSLVKYSDGSTLTYKVNSTTHLLEEIESNYNKKVSFIYNNQTFVKKVIVSADEVLEEIYFEYRDNHLIRITRKNIVKNIIYGLHEYGLHPKERERFKINNYYENKYLQCIRGDSTYIEKIWESAFPITSQMESQLNNVKVTTISVDNKLLVTKIKEKRGSLRELYFDRADFSTNLEYYKAAQMNYEIVNKKYIISYYYSNLNIVGTSSPQLINKDLITNNLVNNGYFENGMTKWLKQKGNVSVVNENAGMDTSHPSYCLGDKVLSVKNGTVTQTIDLSNNCINSHEEYVFSFFSAQKTYDTEQNAKVTLKMYSKNKVVLEKILIPQVLRSYTYNITNISSSKVIDKIEIIINVSNNSIYYFDGFLITKGKTIYSSDYQGNTTTITSGNYAKNIIYNSDNNPVYIWDNYGNITSNTYDRTTNRKNVVLEQKVNKDNYTYDYEYYPNTEKVKTKTVTKDYEVKEITKYDESSRIISVVTNNCYKTEYEYDDLDRITKIIYYENDDLITTKEYNYSNYTTNYDSYETEYTYVDNNPCPNAHYTNGTLKEISNGNQTIEFSNPSNTKVLDTKLIVENNNNTIQSSLYECNDNGNEIVVITNKKNNNSYDQCKYTLTELNNETKVTKLELIGSTNTTYNYTYNPLGNITKIETINNETNTRNESFTYNEHNQLKQISFDGIYCKYAYNLNNSLGMIKYQAHNNTILTYAPLNKVLTFNKDLYYQSLEHSMIEGDYFARFEQNAKLINYIKGPNNAITKEEIVPSYNVTDTYLEDNKYICSSESTPLYYNFTENDKHVPKINIMGFVMPNVSKKEDMDILSISDAVGNKTSLKVNNHRIILSVKIGINRTEYNTELIINIFKWNFIRLTIDDTKTTVQVNTSEVEYNDRVPYSLEDITIGYRNKTTTKTYPFIGSITSLKVSTNIMPEKEEIEQYKMAFIKYVVENTNEVNDDCSYCGTYLYDDNEEITRIPLNNTFLTTAMKKPIIYQANDMLKNEINKNFVFDEEINRHVYYAHGQELIYKLSSSNSQTILMKVKIFKKKVRTIFEYNASSNQKIHLYANKQNEVILNFLGTTYFTGLQLKLNSFSNICVVWDKVAVNYYQTGGYNIKVYVDDKVYETSSSNATFILNPKISIGNSQTKISDDYNNKSICPFDGLIVDIGIASRVLIKSEIDAHFNSVTDLINIKKYNKEGLLLEELVGESTHIYSYDAQDKIIKETINGEEINYTYDKERISAISCQGKTTTYQYDSKNQLIKSIKEGKINEYTYDNSGNITTKKENQNIINYEYDNRFRLIKYKNEEIEYDQESLLPKRCTIKKENGIIESVIDYTWVTNRLTQIIKTSGNNITKIEFEYDQEGRRTSKQVTQNNIERYRYEYIYFNNILKYERRKENTILQYEIEYLYDENSNIYGFIYRKNQLIEKYLYKKDILGNILGILDERNEEVLVYTYDDYGNLISDGINSNGQYNSIKYKGYYYDEETELFYCNSRYYSPELCRFISPDSIEYLDPQSINGTNLYCYCMNDPINYYDPSGHFGISTLIIGAIIGFAVGGATSAVSQGLTKGWDNINGWQVLLDATIGGISGALGASGINQVVSMIAGGVLGAAGSIGGDLIASGGDWNQVNVGKAILMGAIGVGLGRWTGAGTQNSKAMVNTINAGKSWGSKAFLTSAKETLLRPNSGLTLQTMYMNMSKAISLYTVQGITKVSAATLGSTFLGNMIGW